MAIWQYTFSLVPKQALLDEHGAMPSQVDGHFASDEIADDVHYPNYWADSSPKELMAAEVRAVLPEQPHWSDGALLFGDPESDIVELWDDDVRVRLDLRKFNAHLLKAIVDCARREELCP